LPDWILKYLRCPQSGGRLLLASQDSIARLIQLSRDGKLTNVMGRTVSAFSSQGLVSENGRWVYLLENGTPCLLTEEAIELHTQML
jgi:uncharacterized protein YbaR (Trm112 family)